jgi:hypothetical protein
MRLSFSPLDLAPKIVVRSRSARAGSLHRSRFSLVHSVFSAFMLLVVAVMMLCVGRTSAQDMTWALAEETRGLWVVTLDVYRHNPDTLLAITMTRTLRTTNRGEHWDSISAFRTGLGAVAIAPIDWQTVFASIDGYAIPDGQDIYKSTNGGTSWETPIFIGCTHSVGVAKYDPVDPGTIYIGIGCGRLCRSSNAGESWDTSRVGGYLTSLAIAPSNNSILYAGLLHGITRSTNKGASWTALNLGFEPPENVLVAVGPHDANVVYAAVWNDGTGPGGIYKSTNGGAQWIEINNGIDAQHRQVQSICINPTNPDEILLGLFATDRIVLRSTNGGSSWTDFSDGLMQPGRVNAILIDSMHGRIYAGVSSGVYIRDLQTTATSQKANGVPFMLVQNYPNPFNPTTTIRYDLPRGGEVEITIWDLLGRLVTRFRVGQQGVGSYSVTWNGTNGKGGEVSSGVYFYRLEVAGREGNRYTQTRKMVLMR